MSNDRTFLVGETVRLRLRISQAGTRVPADPASVQLVALWIGQSPATLPATVDFTEVTSGEYVLSLDTVAMTPGTYGWRARAADGPMAVSLAEDSFVLRALAGP